MRAQIRQNHIKPRLRHVHDSLQRRRRDGLPFLRLHGAAENFQLRFVALQQPCKKMAVQPVQIVDRVANAKPRMQIQQKMSGSQWPGKIEQHRSLLRMRA